MPSTTAPSLPPVTLAAFEGPLDLLLHLIREHRVDIADIPILQITDQYLTYLRAMEAMNLTVAGEFLVMAATLLEIKSRMLLPKPPRVDDGEEGVDPKQELIQRLQEYERYQMLVGTMAEWESERRALFFRGEVDYGGLYEVPAGFGTLSPNVLIKALHRLLAEAGDGDGQGVTSVRRQKMTLRLAMAALWSRVREAGTEGVLLEECLRFPLVRLEVVMLFLALLELLRQGRVDARQEEYLGSIRLQEQSAEQEADTLA